MLVGHRVAGPVFFLLHVCFILAVDLGASIIGCTELQCPPAEDRTPLCRVGDTISTVIGVANLDTSLTDADLTWTKGVRPIQDVAVDPGTITYESNFYLGTPAGFDLSTNATRSSYDGCALFFMDLSDEVEFEGNISTSVGTCDDIMTTDCRNAIQRQATDLILTFNASSAADACTALESNFSENLVSECAQFATGDKWDGLRVQALTGPDAPKPLTSAQNSSSNCHPTLPKSNSLSLIASINTTSTPRANDIYASLYDITPILTVFFPQKNASGSALLKQVETQLTCLKAVGDLDAPNATSAGAEGLPDSEASAVGMSKNVMIGLGMACTLWILL